MATATYIPIGTTTLSSTTGITFSSIPSTYTDLRLVITSTVNANGVPLVMNFNGVTTTTYSTTLLSAGGSTTSTSNTTSASNISINTSNFTGGSTTVSSLTIVDILSYANTNVFKTALSSSAQDRNGSGEVSMTVGMWRSTAAITSVSVQLVALNMTSGTTATLYGILKA